ncbi:hypothetical protein ABZ552_05600 [Nocardia sp. NPDC019219]|uniref:hypothetical protein n=1 Tax=Nocardia sp. NPDC019219 TaxID=3154590 RepID=UPI0033F1FF84
MMTEIEAAPERGAYVPPPVVDPWFYWLSAHCPRCVHTAAWRPDSLTEPHTFTWRGGATVTTAHACGCCGSRWTVRWPTALVLEPAEDDSETS